MSEFIGSRISLVSRSDIRYVGTLHEINSETSTVALENVSSFGTEGRKGNPDEEIPPSESVYEYIVFRGSDVKDLKIEEAPAVKENKPPQVPNDPAILGSGSRPVQTQVPAPAPRPNQQPQGSQGPSALPGPPQFPQHIPFNQQFYPPPPSQWGRGGPVPGPPYAGMPYGAPPNWYPPHGPGFPHGGPFPYGGYPPGPPGQHYPQQQKPAPIGVGAKQQAPGELSADKPVDTKDAIKATNQVSDVSQVGTTTPPAVSNATSNEAKGPTNGLQPPAIASTTPNAPKVAKAVPKSAPTGPKNGRIIPAVPLPSPIPAKLPLETNPDVTVKASNPPLNTATNRAAIDDATQAATAAVAAAMAKLPPLGGQQTNGNAAVDNLTKKVKEMRTTDPGRGTRQPGGGHRGRGRGGHSHETAKFEVPATDFDFESSNAKFKKQDFVKEATAGSPLTETPPTGQDGAGFGSVPTPPSGTYDKKSSFFDDLSSEIKDRADGTDRPGGRVWRGEEQKKNLETFGQGSVDNGYRGGYRGRGRGRGGHRGRGYGGNGQPGLRGGRNGYRGGRGESQTVSQ